MADGPASRPTEADRSPPGVLNSHLQLRLTVWIDPDRTWHARAEWPPAQRQDFDSPLELARFMARLPPSQPPKQSGGLR